MQGYYGKTGRADLRGVKKHQAEWFFEPQAKMMEAIMKSVLRTGAVLAALAAQAGCVQMETVEAWDRGYLAEDTMQWETDARSARLKGHVYTSKEASTGGAGAAGGGCGCN
jgi:hypothetical protein